MSFSFHSSLTCHSSSLNNLPFSYIPSITHLLPISYVSLSSLNILHLFLSHLNITLLLPISHSSAPHNLPISCSSLTYYSSIFYPSLTHLLPIPQPSLIYMMYHQLTHFTSYVTIIMFYRINVCCLWHNFVVLILMYWLTYLVDQTLSSAYGCPGLV